MSPPLRARLFYHCGTPPVLQHIANAMYRAIIVDPAEPLPPADVSYVLVQSEWYTAQDEGTRMVGDYDKMMTVQPDEVVFNGIAFQYNHHPLTAKVGQRVRLYVINAGPNLPQRISHHRRNVRCGLPRL